MSAAPIVIEHVDHWYGEDTLRRQVLFDVSAEIRAGEIVILSEPSGSSKTTLLTRIGVSRSTQAGSLRIFGRELRGADEVLPTEVMLAQVLEAFAVKAGEVVEAERTRLFLVDEERHELFTLALAEGEPPREIRIPIGRSVAGRAAERGVPVDGDANGESGAEAGLRRILALPFTDATGRVFAVLELASGGPAEGFAAEESRRLQAQVRSLAAVVEVWFGMSCACRKGRGLSQDAGCCAPGRDAGQSVAPEQIRDRG